MDFYLIQGKQGLVEKKAPFILLVARFQHPEDIPRTITDHVITALILVGLTKDWKINFTRNAVKFHRFCIL